MHTQVILTGDTHTQVTLTGDMHTQVILTVTLTGYTHKQHYSNTNRRYAHTGNAHTGNTNRRYAHTGNTDSNTNTIYTQVEDMHTQITVTLTGDTQR